MPGAPLNSVKSKPRETVHFWTANTKRRGMPCSPPIRRPSSHGCPPRGPPRPWELCLFQTGAAAPYVEFFRPLSSTLQIRGDDMIRSTCSRLASCVMSGLRSQRATQMAEYRLSQNMAQSGKTTRPR